jgi:DNA-binding IclR family transcriptional regulator
VASQNARQEPDQRRQRVQAAETCLAVLKALAGLGGRASLTAIGAAVDESPAKVHRYLASLMAEGLVEQDRGGTQYALGREAIHIGLAAMRQNDPVRMSEPALQHLRESLQVTSFVAVMGNMGPTIVRFEEPSLPITVNVRVGSVMSMLWSATGRAFLPSWSRSPRSRRCWRVSWRPPAPSIAVCCMPASLWSSCAARFAQPAVRRSGT